MHLKIGGMILFSVALVIYSFQTLMIKLATKRYLVTPQELLYYFSIITFVFSFISSKINGKDVFDIPPKMYFAVTMRFVMGFLSDILTFIAFTYTSYSKGMCIFFTNTIMIPFFARCILKEKIKYTDMIAILVSFGGMILII